jgi:hypothetical protein
MTQRFGAHLVVQGPHFSFVSVTQHAAEDEILVLCRVELACVDVPKKSISCPENLCRDSLHEPLSLPRSRAGGLAPARAGDLAASIDFISETASNRRFPATP